MLELLDLRERGERLEPSRFEADPTVTETVRGILERVRAVGEPAPEHLQVLAADPEAFVANVRHAAAMQAGGERA